MTADYISGKDSVFNRDWLKEDEEGEEIAPSPEIVLFEWFEIHPLGVEVCPGTLPPKEAWEALVLYLASNNDNLAWQVGATCNRYPKAYHADIYGWFATLLNRSHFTIEQWAHIERSVPGRIGGLSISHHKAVTKIGSSILQREYLETCRAGNWSVSVFREWLSKKGIEVEQEQYQSDRDYEDEQAVYQMANELADAKRELGAIKAKMVMIPESNDGPQFIPGPIARHITAMAGYLKGRPWKQVIIEDTGEVRWIPR